MNTSGQVSIREEVMEFPTYGVGEPDKNPMFFEKRVYQGSSGRVYPLPVIDHIDDEKKMQKWRVIVLENDYLLVWVMPELGGRIQRALDKTNSYDFVYYNHVIKPALVGLAGPWISGGIEFNWPQHHRPSTFSRVEYTLTDNKDGSKTVWLGEIDQMFGTKCTTSITLYTDKAYIEIKSSLYNRTAQPQTFLWWANPAYAVNEHTQSVFPPDVHAVFDHGKRDVSKFPIATGIYYKMDYSAGVDISRYKNIPVPTSYMAYHSDYDFVGGYDHQERAGLLHIADHHISPGKKQWTWGCGDFGQAWDRNLTDSDGPYIELMTGVFTDNQPDFSWLRPFEEKSFTQYFMPYKEAGLVKNANKDIMVNLECENAEIKACVYVTSVLEHAQIFLTGDGTSYEDKTVTLSPAAAYIASFALANGDKKESLVLNVMDQNGVKLIDCSLEEKPSEPVPDPAKPIPEPAEIRTNEELYLAGMHIEQYRHATCEPHDYYLEGLRRNPKDYVINNAYGALLLKQGCFAESERYFRKAIQAESAHNANLYDSEPYYNLGLSHFFQQRFDEAYDAFYKSVWSAPQRCGGYYFLAVVDARRGNFETALEHVNLSLQSNARSLKALNLKTMLLRRLGRYIESADNAAKTRALDILDFGAYNEQYLLADETGRPEAAQRTLDQLNQLMHVSLKNHIELSLDYAWAGFYREAVSAVERYLRITEHPSPLAFYYLGYYYEQSGDRQKAATSYHDGARACPDYCFPNRLEEIIVLQAAQRANPDDAKAYYYLGNLWFDRRQYDKAIACFEKSRKLDDGFATVHRNLSIAYFNKRNDPVRAREAMERAFRLNNKDARVLLELDQLYKNLGVPPADRLVQLENHKALVKSRDDLCTEYITLLNNTGDYKRTLALIIGRRFHPWEGGEGKITAQYVHALVQQGRQFLVQGDARQAETMLQKALFYPESLGEGKLYGAQENIIYYYLGVACLELGKTEEANHCFEKASVGLSKPTSAMFYNDQPPEMIFYQGLAHAALENHEKARGVFNRLIDYAQKHMDDEVKIDYFAVSLPDFMIFDDDLNKRNRVHCHYLLGLGLLGFKKFDEAAEEFNQAIALDAGHQGVLSHLRIAKTLNFVHGVIV